MSIQITNPVRIAGVEQTIGTQLSLDPSLEADLVTRKCAIYLVIPDHGVDPVIRSALNLATGAQITSTWTGTKAQYDAIAVKDANTQYVTDAGIYVGDSLVGVGAEVDPVTGRIKLSPGDMVMNGTPTSPLVTVACGNSITSACRYFASGGTTLGNPASADGFWNPKSEIQLANMLADAPMDFTRMTSGTRIDAFGVYGYSGQTLSTINADLSSNFFTPLASAGVRPQLVIGHALLENDIAAAATNAEIKQRLDLWLAHVKAMWPGVRVLLCTPRTSFSYDSAAKVSAFNYAVQYTLSLDDSATVFVADVSVAYADQSNPAVPLSGYTDASGHPNPKGALKNARIIAATLRRIVPVVRRDWTMLSANVPLSGSISVAGTRVTGTGPTGSAVGTPASGSSIVSEALNPGWRMTYSVPANATPVDMSTINIGYPSSATTAPNIGAFAKVRIVSGAVNIRSIELANRHSNNDASNDWRYLVKQVSGDIDCGAWMDGDELTMMMPLFPPTTAKTLTGISPYFRVYGNLTGGDFTLEVLAFGNRTA